MGWTTCATVEPVRAVLIVATAEAGPGASVDLTGAITAVTEAAAATGTAEEVTAGTEEEAIEETRATVGVGMTAATETGTGGVEALPVVEIRTRGPVWKMVPLLRQPTSICPVAFKEVCPFIIHSCRVC